MSAEQSFGQVVKTRRRELGLTQDELARRVGCAPVTLRKIEYDDLRPSVQIAERLAMALNIPLEERAAFVRLARAERQSEPATPTPAPRPEEIGIEDLTGKAIRGYALGERIGNGGMGAVYRAVQPLVEREVAIKIILPQFANHPDFIRRFEAEAQLVARLEHPHVVPLYDYWREPSVAYLVMRLLRGGSLRSVLEHGPIPLDMTLRMMEQVGSALGAAHRAGVIHRDLKPGNILLDEDQNAYLADFGIAKNLGNPNLEDATQVDAIVGSPAYISPEQIRSEFVRPQTDIYCLGVVLYELLTGDLPFTGPTPIEVMHQHLNAPLPPLAARRAGLPGQLDAVIERATVKDPLERYPNVESFLVDLRSAVSRQPSFTIPQLPITENPYKGLRAFGEGDTADFFGREALTQQLLVRMGEGGDLSRFLAVVGPSGSGKSSVVGAGLVPALRRGALPGSDQWFIVELMPGPRPFEELEAALLRVAVDQPVGALHVTPLLTQLMENERGLLRAVRRCLPDDPNVELVLVIDQFEEVFTLLADESERALLLSSLVTAALDERSRVRVVITLRADFTDRPLRYVDFGELLRQRMEVVLPLTPDELERAIIGPAERVGLQFESGLAATILRDVGDQPGALPLLQYALTELFEKREGNTLTKTAYQSIGGVLGALGRRAEEVFGQLDEAGQSTARQLFLRLVTLGEGVEDTRRRVLRAELESLTTKNTKEVTKSTKEETLSDLRENLRALSGLIEAFGKHRLISFDRDPLTRGPTVEVAHEAILREWGRLREWLSESRADVRLQRQLATATAEWQSANRESSFLLTGARLEQFEGWAANTTVALTGSEQAYLEASLAERDRRVIEERERQRRELDDAQRIAEAARKLAETERARADEQVQYVARVRTRNRAIAIAGTIALVLAVLAGLFGLQSNQNATLAQQNLGAAQVANTQSAANAATAEAASVLALANAATAQFNEQSRATQQAVAESESLRAEQEKQLATSRELAAAAIANLQVDSERSILLALEALSTANTKEAEGALHRAVEASRLRLTLMGHTKEVIAVAFSSDGTRIVTGSADTTAQVWEAATGELLLTLSGHTDAIYGIAFSPDGRRIATASMDKTAKVWDATTGKLLLTFSGHADVINGIAFSPDGTRILTGSADKTAQVWEAATGKLLLTFAGHTDEIFGVAYSPDGRRIATASVDRTAKVWDAFTGAELFTLSGYQDAVGSAAFSPDGKRLAIASDDGSLQIWDALSGEELVTMTGDNTTAYAVAFNPDGTRLATGSQEGTARVWDALSGEELLTLAGNAGAVYNIAFSPDCVGPPNAAFKVCGTRLVSGNRNGTAMVWDVTPAGGQELFMAPGFDGRISPDGTRLAVLDFNGTNAISIQVWRLPEGSNPTQREGEPQELISVIASHAAEITSPSLRAVGGNFSPDNTRLATVSSDMILKVWNTLNGKELLNFSVSTHALPVTRVAFSSDNAHIATASADMTAKVWDAANGKELLTLSGHTDTLTDVAFSPDGTRLATCSFDGMAKVWDAITGHELFTLVGHTQPIIKLGFSPDGKLIATASFDATVKLWDAATGKLLLNLSGHTATATGVAFSPDGARLASASTDGTVKVWSFAPSPTDGAFVSRELITLLPGFSGSVSFSPDGTRLITSSFPGLVRVYLLNIEELIALAKSHVTRSLTTEECQKYLHVETCPAP